MGHVGFEVERLDLSAPASRDARIVSKVGDREPPTGSALTPTYARRHGNRTIGLGDSIMRGSDGLTSGFGGSWFSMLSEVSGQRLRRVRNSGIAGNTTAQMLARIDSDVTTYAPDICVIEGITPNDVGSLTQAQSKANIIAMIDACVAAGIRPIVCTGPPNDKAETNLSMRQMSTWMVKNANERGIAVFDLYAHVADPATGIYVTDYTDDGTHPNNDGQNAIAIYLAGRIPDDIYLAPLGSTASGDPTNLLANGAFVGDSNSDGYADNWNVSGLVSGSLEAREDGLGFWQVITGDSALDFLTGQAVPGWAVGDVIRVSGEWINVDSDALTVIVYMVTGTPDSQLRPLSSRSEKFTGTRRFYIELPIAAGTVSLYVRLVPGVGTGKFSHVAIENLTALGIA